MQSITTTSTGTLVHAEALTVANESRRCSKASVVIAMALEFERSGTQGTSTARGACTCGGSARAGCCESARRGRGLQFRVGLEHLESSMSPSRAAFANRLKRGLGPGGACDPFDSLNCSCSKFRSAVVTRAACPGIRLWKRSTSDWSGRRGIRSSRGTTPQTHCEHTHVRAQMIYICAAHALTSSANSHRGEQRAESRHRHRRSHLGTTRHGTEVQNDQVFFLFGPGGTMRVKCKRCP